MLTSLLLKVTENRPDLVLRSNFDHRPKLYIFQVTTIFRLLDRRLKFGLNFGLNFGLIFRLRPKIIQIKLSLT